MGRRIQLLGGMALSTCLVVSSCDSSSDQAPQSEITAITAQDSGGVRLVTTHRLEWDTIRTFPGAPEAIFPANESSTSLSLVRDAARIGENRVAAYDLLEQRLFVLSRGSEPDDTLGGPGEGPGEFAATASMMVVDSMIELFDRSLRRITQLDTNGSIRRIVSLQPPGFDGNQHVSNAWMVDEDRVLVWEYVESEQRPVSSSGDAERWVTPGQLRIVNLASSTAQTLMQAPARDWIVEGSRWWVAPFGPYTTLVYKDRRVYLSPGTHHVVNVVDPDSGWVASYRYPNADRPFDLQELARLEDEARREAAEGGHPFMAEALFSEDIQPPMQPAIQNVRVTDWGEVWAQVHAPAQHDSPDWWIIGPNGRYRGIVRLPERREILGFDGDYAIIRSLDAFDVPTVEVWSLPPDLRSQRRDTVR